MVLGLLLTARSPLRPPVYKQKHKTLTKVCWHTQPQATQSSTWTAVNSPLSTAASRLQTETQNINKSVLTHSATGHAQWYLDCCQKKAHSPLPPPVYKQKHKTLTKVCWHTQPWATQSGTWTAVNIPLSIAASRLQPETRNTNRRLLTNWLSHGPRTAVLGLPSTACSPLSSPIYKQKHKPLTELSHAQWYLDCCQQPILHCHLLSTNRNTKHLQKSADKLSHKRYGLNCPQQCCLPPSQMYRK